VSKEEEYEREILTNVVLADELPQGSFPFPKHIFKKLPISIPLGVQISTPNNRIHHHQHSPSQNMKIKLHTHNFPQKMPIKLNTRPTIPLLTLLNIQDPEFKLPILTSITVRHGKCSDNLPWCRGKKNGNCGCIHVHTTCDRRLVWKCGLVSAGDVRTTNDVSNCMTE
jgi:hypothetical protein